MPSRKLIDDVIAAGEIGQERFLTANLGYAIERSERLAEPALRAEWGVRYPFDET